METAEQLLLRVRNRVRARVRAKVRVRVWVSGGAAPAGRAPAAARPA